MIDINEIMRIAATSPGIIVLIGIVVNNAIVLVDPWSLHSPGEPGHPDGVEARNRLCGIPAANGGNLRVGTVDDDPHRRGLPAGEQVGSALWDDQGNLGRARVEQRLQLGLGGRVDHHGEVARRGEARLELSGDDALVEVDDCRRHVAHVHGHDVAEADQLHDRHEEEQPQQQRVAAQLEELLPHQQADPGQAHVRLPCNRTAMSRATVAYAASAATCGHSSSNPAPLSNTPREIVTM